MSSLAIVLIAAALCASVSMIPPASQPAPAYVLDYDAPLDPALQSTLEAIDVRLRAQFEMTPAQAAVGVLDLKTNRLAMIHPDRIEYAASVSKVGILLAYFTVNPDLSRLDPKTQHELADMAKASSNEMAAKYSQQIGLKPIQAILQRDGFYDEKRGGGIWVGKHYGITGERYGDPVGDNSHGATVRQLLRFWLLLDQGKLVSPDVSAKMKEIFATPTIPHDDIKFVAALKDRDVQILRKWGSWEDWLHDTALIEGAGRRYILVALTKHPRGDDYLVELAKAIDDELKR